MRILSILILTCLSFQSLAGVNIRIRAREHYDILKFTKPDKSELIGEEYSGFSNRFNLWIEKPFYFSFGLAYGSIFSKLKTKENVKEKEVASINLGLEAKYFPMRSFLFFRVGLFQNTLTADQEYKGKSAYLGLGYEYNWDGIGIAPEIAVQKGNFEDLGDFTIFTPSIGVHFYKFI